MQEKKDMEELTNSARKENGKYKSEGSTNTSSPSEDESDEEFDDVDEDEDDVMENGDEAYEEQLDHTKGEESEDEFWYEEQEEEGETDLLTILSREQVVSRQLALVETVAAELGRDMWEAALLMQHFRSVHHFSC